MVCLREAYILLLHREGLANFAVLNVDENYDGCKIGSKCTIEGSRGDEGDGGSLKRSNPTSAIVKNGKKNEGISPRS